jgi:hypothetical protein
VGERHVALFRDPPLQASFRVFRDRDGELNLAEAFFLETFEAQDDTGAVESNLLAPVEIARGENEIEIKAQGVTFFTAPGDTGTRTIQLNSTDMRNLNLRTIHDAIYAAPTGDEVIEFILPSGFTVGSTSTGSPAIRTGTWPTMATAPLLTNNGRIQGRGGNGSVALLAGSDGGPALKAEADFSVDNLNGEIWSGGGGGSGNGGIGANAAGGGGGAGTDPGLGGVSSTGPDGAPGTSEAGGAGGVPPVGNSAGDGGGPGLAGESVAAAGGSPGDYIEGNSFVTWVNDGDRRGGVS